jgi:hypothetical protein
MEAITTQQTVAALLGAAALGLLIYLLVRLTRRLRARPDSVFRRISRQRLKDVLIEDGLDGEIHLEHVMLTAHGALVVDLRNADGAVFGGPRLEEWKVMSGQRRFAFRNPLEPLAARVQAVERLVYPVPVFGRVVFVGEVEFPGGSVEQVSTLSELEAEFADPGDSGKALDAFQSGWGRLAESAKPHPPH